MAALMRPRCRWSGAVLAAAFVLAQLLGFVEAPPAFAQGFGFLGDLFGGGRPQRQGAPAYPGYGGGGYGYGDGSDATNRYYSAPRRAPRKKRPVEQAQEPAKPKPPPKNATVFVDVYGDSLGQMLAGGLDEALADRSEVGIVRKAKGSTGLVTTSFYDWQKAIDEQLASKDPKDKIDVAVMMIGINDRQVITEEGNKLEPGSEAWTAVYKKRVLAIDEAFAKRKIPLVWVGIPITKDDNFADDMAAFNDIYREAAAKTGATYVDTWEAFSDDKGDFAAFGPDINGQTVRLRASDGIHFTKAGARKLAHFVETHVLRDLDGKAPLPQLPTAEAPAGDKAPADAKKPGDKDAKPAVALVKPEAGPIRNLGEAPFAKDGRLAEVPKDHPSVANVQAKGAAPETPPTPAARADNFRWPAEGVESPKP